MITKGKMRSCFNISAAASLAAAAFFTYPRPAGSLALLAAPVWLLGLLVALLVLALFIFQKRRKESAGERLKKNAPTKAALNEPAVSSTNAAPGRNPEASESSEILESARELAKERPEDVAKLLRSWIDHE